MVGNCAKWSASVSAGVPLLRPAQAQNCCLHMLSNSNKNMGWWYIGCCWGSLVSGKSYECTSRIFGVSAVCSLGKSARALSEVNHFKVSTVGMQLSAHKPSAVSYSGCLGYYHQLSVGVYP
jgi:hypothetical protein